ncbi:MAG: FkbM family methyltransferase [bacterium]|jgi:hypothetical protein
MSLLFQLYRVVVPKPIRTKILLNSLRKKIPAFHEADPSFVNDPERKEVIEFVKKNGVEVFPYSFTEQYVESDIDVFLDEQSGMRYVLMDGKRLYFKKRWTASRIRRSFHDLSLEQDNKSPHRYLSEDFKLADGDVLADVGAAEGNFSLSVIEAVKKVYLFESDPEWIEALKKTFEPWREKVEIIPKFISDKNDARNYTGDNFFADKELNFLKIDVDGGERKLLKGFDDILSQRTNLKIALCTYHQHDDEIEFSALLRNKGFSVTPSRGYMIFYYDKKLKAPYLRRALLRAVKS